MVRWIVVRVASVVLLGMLAMPLGVAAQGNSETAHACQQGGYLNLTDAAGNAFKNTGECVRDKARGSGPPPAGPPQRDLSITGGITAADGVISGTGFTPGATIVELYAIYYGLDNDPIDDADYQAMASGVSGSGSFATTGGLLFCWDTSVGSVLIVATDSAGVGYEELFPLRCR